MLQSDLFLMKEAKEGLRVRLFNNNTEMMVESKIPIKINKCNGFSTE